MPAPNSAQSAWREHLSKLVVQCQTIGMLRCFSGNLKKAGFRCVPKCISHSKTIVLVVLLVNDHCPVSKAREIACH
jgi:hypothetical protein